MPFELGARLPPVGTECVHHPNADCGCYCRFVGCSPETCPGEPCLEPKVRFDMASLIGVCPTCGTTLELVDKDFDGEVRICPSGSCPDKR